MVATSCRTSPTNRHKAISLFAGVGGLDLGVTATGFEIALAVEYDRHTAEQYQINFSNTEVQRKFRAIVYESRQGERTDVIDETSYGDCGSESVRIDNPKKAAEKLLQHYQGEKLQELINCLMKGLEPSAN